MIVNAGESSGDRRQKGCGKDQPASFHAREKAFESLR